MCADELRIVTSVLLRVCAEMTEEQEGYVDIQDMILAKDKELPRTHRLGVNCGLRCLCHTHTHTHTHLRFPVCAASTYWHPLALAHKTQTTHTHTSGFLHPHPLPVRAVTRWGCDAGDKD